MLPFASYLAAAALTLHALLGCCWHHVHADADEPVLCCHEHPSEDHSPVDHDHEHSPCDEGGCVFVKCDRITYESTTVAVAPLLMTEPLLPDFVSIDRAPADDATLLLGLEAHFLCARLRC